MSVVSNELIKLETFEAMQKHYFEAVLKAAKGKISGTDGAAALSGMHPNTLRSKLDKRSSRNSRIRLDDDEFAD